MMLTQNDTIVEGRANLKVQEVTYPTIMTPTCSTRGVHVTVKNAQGKIENFCYDQRAEVTVK